MGKSNKGTDLEQAMPKIASDSDMKWQNDQDARDTQDHVKTLHSAFDILQDPAKMQKVHKLAGRHAKAIKSLGDLKLARDNFGKKNSDDPTEM